MDRRAGAGARSRAVLPAALRAPAFLSSLLVFLTGMAWASSPSRGGSPLIAERIEWGVEDYWREGRWTVVWARFGVKSGSPPIPDGAAAVVEWLGRNPLEPNPRVLRSYGAPLARSRLGFWECRIPVFIAWSGIDYRISLYSGTTLLGSWTPQRGPHDQDHSLGLLLSTARHSFKTVSSSERTLVPLDAADVPASALALGPFSTIVVDDVPLTSLGTAQLAAIDRWVLGGGHLVFTAKAMRRGIPDRWRPAALRPGPDAVVSPVAAGKLLMDSEGALTQARALALDAPYADWLVTDGENPLVVNRPHGLGRLVGIAVDPERCLTGADPARATGSRYAALLTRGDTRKKASGEGRAVTDLLIPESSRVQPIRWYVIGFLLLAAVLIGPVNYLVLTLIRRQELSIVTVPVAVLLIAVAAYAAGLRLRSSEVEVRRFQVMWVQPSREGICAEEWVGIRSPGRREYEVVAHGPDTGLTLPREDGDSDTKLPFHLASGPLPGKVRAQGVEIPPATMRFLHARGTLDLPGTVHLRCVIEGETLRLTAANRLPWALEDAHLLLGARHVSLGTLRPGQEVARTLPARLPAGDVTCEPCRTAHREPRIAARTLWTGSAEGKLSSLCLAQVLDDDPQSTGANPLLVARATSAPHLSAPVGIAGHQTPASVLICPGRVDLSPGRFLLSSDLCQARRDARRERPKELEAVWDLMESTAGHEVTRYLSSMETSPVRATFAVPARGPRVSVEKAVLHVSDLASPLFGEAARIRIFFEGPGDARRQQVPLEKGEPLAIAIAGAQRLIDPVEGTFHVIVESEAGTDTPIQMPHLALEVTGTLRGSP